MRHLKASVMNCMSNTVNNTMSIVACMRYVYSYSSYVTMVSSERRSHWVQSL